MRWFVLLVPIALVAGSGCRCGAGADAPGGGARLVPDTEIEAMRARLQAVLTANAHKDCKRPVLHGAAVPGPADEDLVALVEASGPLADCAQASGNDLVDALRTCETAHCRGRALDDPASLEAPVLASTLACAPLDDAVTGAAAHDDACSPYVPGRRATPQTFTRFVALSRAVEVRARHLAQEGETAGALRLSLDWLRVAQDLGRGGAGLLPTMVGSAAMTGPLAQLETILSENRLTAAELEDATAEVDALIASEPPIATILEGDHVDTIVDSVLPVLDDPQPAGRRDRLRAMPTTKSFAENPRDEIALVWLALDESHAAERAACPATGTLEACAAALARASAEAEAAAGRIDIARALRGPAAEARRAVIRILRGAGTEVRATYVRRLASRRALLAALRLHLEALRQAAAGDSCPAAAAYDAEPLAGLRRPALLGGTLGVAAGADGAIDITTPTWMNPSQRVWTIRCPAAR